MKIISAEEIDAVLDPAGLADALADAFRSDMVAPVRHHHDIERQGPAATLLLMPAWTGMADRPSFVGTKIVTVYPTNGEKNLPAVMGTYLLLDGTTGAPLAAMDGARLTVWRTAAASALAARYCARPNTASMLMVGAGALAPFLIKGHCAASPITEIELWNHKPDRAEQIAALLRKEGYPVKAVTDLEKAVRKADLVSTATLSTEPLIKGEWLKPGTHLDCVGAFKPSMRETDDLAVQRASLFCDTRGGALHEGGDYAQPLAKGLIQETAIKADLVDLTRGKHRGRSSPDEITMFKSVGAAIEDLAAAMLVWQRVA